LYKGTTVIIPALIALLVLVFFVRVLPKIVFRILLVLILVPLAIGFFLVSRELSAVRQRIFPTPTPAIRQQNPPLPIARPQAKPSR
jgi:hypothetical protein